MAGAFADQVGAVVLGLIAAVLEDDEQHGDAHEDAEDHHRGGNREVGLDEQGVDAEHHEDGGVLIEVLHGDGASRAHEDMAAVLQERVHRNDEEARADAHEDHDEAGDHDGPGKLEAEEREAACGRNVAREVGGAHDEHAHADAHGQNVEGLLERNLGGGEEGADGDAEAHDGLHDGTLREIHAERPRRAS